MSSNRILKVNSLIRQELTQILTREVSLKPGVFITVAKVSTTRDLRTTRIFVSIFPTKETHYAMKTLSHEKVPIQKELHSKLCLKILPKISFIYDETEEQADTIEKIFKKLSKEK